MYIYDQMTWKKIIKTRYDQYYGPNIFNFQNETLDLVNSVKDCISSKKLNYEFSTIEMVFYSS